MDLSVVLITLNEGNNIRRCLSSLPKGCELIVLDSGSQDDTVSLARSMQARVEHRNFDNYANQKNAALSLATRSWVLSLDADEVLEPACRQAIEEVVLKGVPAAYRINRHLVFMGRVMKYGRTKDHPVRLFPRDSGLFEGAIHEKLSLQSSIAVHKLPSRAIVLHYSYKNLRDYFERFNRYTDQIALDHFSKKEPMPPILVHVMRPWWDFMVRYFLKGGFLDGYPGYVYAMVSSVYGFIKYSKLREMIVKQND
jgi:glycosyltransferase involved in cell wall biosynthesis